MKSTILLLTALSALALSGCHHHVSGQLKTKSVSIGVNTDSQSAPAGKHCPPGQAKKGRC